MGYSIYDVERVYNMTDRLEATELSISGLAHDDDNYDSHNEEYDAHNHDGQRKLKIL